MFAGAMTLVRILEHNCCMQEEPEDHTIITGEVAVTHNVYQRTQAITEHSVAHSNGVTCLEQNMKIQMD